MFNSIRLLTFFVHLLAYGSNENEWGEEQIKQHTDDHYASTKGKE